MPFGQDNAADELWELEAGFWLQAAAYDEANLAPDAQMNFPGQAGLLLRQQSIEAVAGAQRWEETAIGQRQRLRISPRIVLLTYLVTDRRPSAESDYRAHALSCYRLDEGHWLLAYHQQVPSS